jgi:putative flippase GtrA
MIKQLFYKYKNFIAFGFWGVCTTAVNMVVYCFFANVVRFAVLPSAIIAWVVAVLFAYLTNRKMVFHSQTNSTIEVLKEIVAFFACRIATGVLDWLCMFVFVELIHLNDLLIKVAANMLVILLNYVASKVFIFKQKNAKGETDHDQY